MWAGASNESVSNERRRVHAQAGRAEHRKAGQELSSSTGSNQRTQQLPGQLVLVNVQVQQARAVHRVREEERI